jgi:hypothetical protein
MKFTKNFEVKKNSMKSRKSKKSRKFGIIERLQTKTGSSIKFQANRDSRGTLTPTSNGFRDISGFSQ